MLVDSFCQGCVSVIVTARLQINVHRYSGPIFSLSRCRPSQASCVWPSELVAPIYQEAVCPPSALRPSNPFGPSESVRPSVRPLTH